MKRMKKLLSAVLALAMIMSMIVLPVAAEDATETIAVGETKQLTVGPGVDVSVSFTAAESGSYIFYRPTADAVMGQLFGPEGVVEGRESWSDDAHRGEQFPAEAGVTYTYTLWHDTSDTVETSVTLIKVEEEQVETIAVGETKNFSLESKASMQFSFTPAESGRYIVYTPIRAIGTAVYLGTQTLPLDHWQDSKSQYVGGAFEAEAGTSYLVEVKNWMSSAVDSSVTVVKAAAYESIEIDMTAAGLVGEEVSVYVKATPDMASEAMTWTVSDPTVAEIMDTSCHYAHLKLLRPGTVTVTATAAGGLSDSCILTVKEETELTLGQTVELSVGLREYESFIFTPEETGRYIFYTPSEGNLYFDACNRETNGYLEAANWQSSDGAYSGVAFDMEGGISYSLEATNWDHEPTVNTTLSVAASSNYTSIAFTKSRYTGYVASYIVLELELAPVFGSDEITLSTSDENIAMVESFDGKYVYVAMYDVGTVTVTARTAGGLSASCKVTALEPVELVRNQPVATTIGVNENALFYFEAPASGTYSFYAEGEGYCYYMAVNASTGEELDSSNYWYKNGVEGINYSLSAGDLYLFYVFNLNETDTAFNVCIGQTVKATGIRFAAQSGDAYRGIQLILEPWFVPALAASEDITWTSSNTSIVKYANKYEEGSYEYYYFDVLGAGKATLTAKTASGLTAEFTLNALEPEDIQPGSHSTMELSSGNYVVYNIIPESTATYKIIWPDSESTNVGIWHATDELDGRNYMDGDLEVIEVQLTAGEEYVLLFQNVSDSARSFTFRLEGTAAFAMNEAKQVTIPQDEMLTFRFTAPKDGVYTFACCDNASGVLVDIETLNGETVNVDELRQNKWGNTDFDVTLTGGETYVFKAYTDGLEERQCILAIGQYGKATELNLNADHPAVYPNMQFALHVDFGSVFAQEEAITFTSSDPAVVDVNPKYEEETGLAGPGFKAYKPGKATITATSENGLTATCEITVLTPGTIGLGEHTTPVLDNNEFITYYFTPETSGDYNLYLTSEMDFVLKWSSLAENERELWKGEDYVGFRAHLEAGETYTIYVENFYMQGAKTFTFWLEAAPHEHEPVLVAEKAPGYAKPGMKAHYACACGILFADAEGTTEVTAEELTIPQLIQIADGKTEIGADIIADAAENAADGKVTIPVADAGEVKYAEIPAAALTQMATKNISLTLEMTAAAVTMDSAALANAAEKAGDAQIALEVKKIPAADLTESQMAAIEALEQTAIQLLSIELTVNGRSIANEAAGGFGSGKVTVQIPVQLATDEYTVLYLADDGSSAIVEGSTYTDGILTMTLEHFSVYAILQDCLPGDTNDDGKITILDLMRLANYFAGKDVDLNTANADTNGDGKVTILDLMRLANYFAGKDVTLGKS